MLRSNPKRLNPLQLRTLALLQALAREQAFADLPDSDGAVAIHALPHAHGYHVHIGPAVVSARDASDPRIDPSGTDGHVVVRAGAAVTVDGLDIALHADNVLDRRYREHGSGTDAPGLDIGLLVRRRF